MMIKTFFDAGTLNTPQGYVAALLIGVAFGFVLQRAGFGSSKKLSGVFYFRDMTVIKVMFTAMVTAMLGLVICVRMGWYQLDSLYLLPTTFKPQVIGGLIFGVGFVVGGWCPGTAAAGLAQGKIDALVFLIGAIGGSVLFNEVYHLIKPWYEVPSQGVLWVYESLHLSQGAFVLAFVGIAIVCFGVCESIERSRRSLDTVPSYHVLKAICVIFVVVTVALYWMPVARDHVTEPMSGNLSEAALLQSVDLAQDHMEPEVLADRLMAEDKTLLLVDIRPAQEYAQGHIRGAVRIAMADLHASLQPYKNRGTIVLYSNGMTHPVQARDSLARAGFSNVYILTDGLIGFQQRVLKPVSLRSTPLSAAQADAVNQWRAFFNDVPKVTVPQQAGDNLVLPGAQVDTTWLSEHLSHPALRIIDLRAQAQYNTSHIPGSLALGVENVRTHVLGLGSMLNPVELLTRQMELMGLHAQDCVVLVPSDAIRDATLVGLALERVGHGQYAILKGGFEQWVADQRPVTADLPDVTETVYPKREGSDTFTVTAVQVLEAVRDKKAVILDARPVEYFQGTKSDEARAGHVPGALNRPFTDDVQKTGTVTSFKPIKELAFAYAKLIPFKQTPVIVHCRTGHQASQTVFVLKHLLAYQDVKWYDGGWSEWAARKALPVE